MNTVVPPQPPAQAPISPLPQASLVVIDPPPSLSGLALGARLEGLVIGPAGEGQVQIQTSRGVLTAVPNLSLPTGVRLILVLQAVNHLQSPSPGQSSVPGQFRILSIDGRPPGQAATAATTPASSPTLGAAAPVTLTVGSTVTATLLGTVPGAAAASGAGPASPAQPTGFQPVAGTQAGTAQGQSQGQIQGQSQGRIMASGAASSAGPAPAATATPIPPAQGPLPAGTQVTFRITALQPPAAGAPFPALAPVTLAAGVSIAAVVNGTTSTGQPQILTPAGAMVLNSAGSLPQGTAVTLTVAGEPVLPPPAAEGAPSPFSREGFMHARTWANLEETLQALGQVNPAAANTLANSIIPQPNAQLTNNILFFVAALRGGDIRGWMGNEPVRLLQRFKPELLGRMRVDFRSLSRLAEEPRTGDWRTWLIPLHDGGQIQQIRLLTRKGGGNDESEEAGNMGIRFVVDVTLTRMGRMQLDGLANGQNKRLDLIVRTDAPLDKTVRNDIRRIFGNAAQVTGLTGSVGFQAAPPEFIEVSAVPAGEAVGVIA